MENISEILWGPFTAAIVLLCGAYHTYRSLTRKRDRSKPAGRIKGRKRAVMSALGASMGTGNITGCAAAIASGGAGAVFWMWVSAALGMGLAYSENRIGAIYKERYPELTGSPMLYMEKGLGAKRTAGLYAFFCLLAALSMGCMSQTGAMCDVLCEGGILPRELSAAICAAVIGIVIFSSKKASDAAMDAADRLVPVMGLIYLAGCLLLIAGSGESVLSALSLIIKEAFSLRAAAGGAAGTVMKKAVSTGLRRGIFSNEAGMGSSVLVHSEADFGSPESTGRWAASEVFIDTILCCTLTALVLLTGKSGSLSEVFSDTFGRYGALILCVCVCLFALAAALGWCCYGEKCLFYLTGGRFGRAYKGVFCLCAALSGFFPTSALFGLSDIINLMLIFPNVTAITLLVHREYIQQKTDR